MQPFSVGLTPKITELYTTYSKKFEPEYRFKGETHDFWELVCVKSGKIGVAADSDVFELYAGQAILHPPMQFHNITVTGNDFAEVTVFTFSGENIPSLTGTVCEIDISEVNAAYRSVCEHFNIRGHLLIDSPKGADNRYFEYIKRLEMLLTLLYPLPKSYRSKSLSALNYSRIVAVMNENVEKRLSVKDIAHLCNMSEIGLQKTFSYYAGVGVMSYFNRLKMRHSAEMLKCGTTVKEAALSVGFEDQNYFSTVFKRITGVSPTEYINGGNG